jgi:chaperonin cofactor prefoldin
MEYSEQVAAKIGLVLDDSFRFTDRGLSAYTGAHRTKGALGEFLRLVEQGAVPEGSVLLVESLDRLSREQVLDALTQFTGIIRAGIKVMTLADNMEYDRESINANFGQLLMSLVIMARAYEESATKSRRAIATWAEKRKRAASGERKLTARCPEWLKLSEDRKSFIVLTERAQVINQIYEMKLVGKGSGLIEQELNKSDVWKPKNGWRKSYINKNLRNRAVIGEFQPHGKVKAKAKDERGKEIEKVERQPVGDPIPDYYPAIVEKELFNRVQAAIQQNAKTLGKGGGRNGNVSNLFRHLAACSKCGGPMAYMNKGPKPKGGQYLQCDTAGRGLGCSKKTVRYDVLEPMILTYCEGLDAADILPGNEKRISELSVLRNELQALEGETGEVDRKLRNIEDSIEDTDSREFRQALEARYKALLGRDAELEEKRADLQSRIKKLANAPQETEQRLKSMKELIERMNELEGQDRVDLRLNLRSQLRRLIERIDVSQGAYSWNKRQWQRYTLHFGDGASRTLLMGKAGDLWEVHDQEKKGTTFLYRLDTEGNVTDVDVEYPREEAARRKRQARETDKKVAAALRKGKRQD